MFRKSNPHAAALSVTELCALVKAVAADEASWLARLELPTGRDRWWERLSGDDRVDVWLLSWLPGHSTDLHDHGASSAAFTVVRGRIVELRQAADGRLHAMRRDLGSVTGLAPGSIHDVHGSGREPAVSIHAYSPPLREMNYYGVDDAGGLRLARTVHTREPEMEAVT